MHTTSSNKPRKAPHPIEYARGDVVRDVYTGEEFVVIRSYWQNYAGGDTADYTVCFEATATQPTPWNKSRNLELVQRAR